MTGRLMRWVVGAWAVGGVIGAGGWAQGGEARHRADPARAIVKIYVAAVWRDATAPWRPGWSISRTGSGAVISGGRILTAAHVVEDQTFVQIRLNGTASKVQARVLFVSHMADLALLSVEDPAALRDVVPLKLGELPDLRDKVTAYGFPNGGETLSITEGVVARVEHWPYAHSQESLLTIQMDAAIAPGSSGGPVLRKGRIVGVAMQGFKDSSIGCAVPSPLVRQFLADVEDGRLDGIPELGIAWQALGNDVLRSSLGLPKGESGVLLRSAYTSPDGAVLQEGDVLLALGGQDVADDGTVELREGERAELSQVTDGLQVGDRVSVRYLHGGVVHQSSIVLERARGEGKLVPRLFDRGADYFIFGGLAFVSLTQNMLDALKAFAPPALLALGNDRSERPGDGLVFVASVLASEVNAGYEDAAWEIVRSVDGRPVANLAQLVSFVEEPTGASSVTFALGNGSRVTMDRRRAVASGPDLLARYELAADRSPRLRALAGGGGHVAAAATPSSQSDVPGGVEVLGHKDR
jgi:S1-C subfamily serine protease